QWFLTHRALHSLPTRRSSDLVDMTLEHCTEGHLIVDEMVKAGFPCAVGPSFGNATKVELKNKTWETPGILAAAGCQVSIITDARSEEHTSELQSRFDLVCRLL